MTDREDSKSALDAIATLPEFLAYAHAMEIEAEERYTMLADQMEVHNNPDLATLFRRLSEVEAKHAAEILERAGDGGITRVDPLDLRWGDLEGPETADIGDAHYLMTPYHALEIALKGEEAAVRFFERIAQAAASDEVREVAESFAEEEREHVAKVREMLARHPKPEEGWSDDLDPPNVQE
jgi:rubrerythrin